MRWLAKLFSSLWSTSVFDTVAQGALDFAVGSFAFEGLAFVVLGFAFAEAELDFGEAFREVDFQRDKRHAFSVKLTGESVDFFFVQQQATRTQRINIPAVAEFVGGDVRVVQPALAALDAGERIVNGCSGVAEAFDLGAFQFDAGFVGLADEVVPAGFVIVDGRRHRRKYITP